MPYLETAQSWLEQSTLLLKARPTTVRPPITLPHKSNSQLTPSQTRITTKYTLLSPSKAINRTVKPKTSTDDSSPAPSAAPIAEPIRATLTLKTFDPVSGATLKYSTIKQAEVARLIQILGRLARPMAGLPEVKEDLADVVEGEGKVESGVTTPVGESAGKAAQGGAGGKKKKKGKK
jgi:hypothetical protein